VNLMAIWRAYRTQTRTRPAQALGSSYVNAREIAGRQRAINERKRAVVRTPEKNYLRAWREYRGMTQSALAEKVNTTGAVISLLESGQRGLGDKWLRRLAPVLGTTPGHLLEFAPQDADTDIMQVWNDIAEDDRPQVLQIVKTFARQKDERTVVDLPRPSKAGASDETQKSKTGRRGKGPKEV
jgi:transcriptional regulator with XRE-family HTH domain